MTLDELLTLARAQSDAAQIARQARLRNVRNVDVPSLTSGEGVRLTDNVTEAARSRMGKELEVERSACSATGALTVALSFPIATPPLRLTNAPPEFATIPPTPAPRVPLHPVATRSGRSVHATEPLPDYCFACWQKGRAMMQRADCPGPGCVKK
jgi:hypothetical protein